MTLVLRIKMKFRYFEFFTGPYYPLKRIFLQFSLDFFPAIPECEMIGQCIDAPPILETSLRNEYQCRYKCQRQRRCQYSTFSEKNKKCYFHNTCTELNTTWTSSLSSKWNCTISPEYSFSVEPKSK